MPLSNGGTVDERTLENHLKWIAQDLGLLLYHTYDSRRSAPGFPDLVIAGPGGVLFRELKTEKGRLTVHQERWGNILAASGADIGVWRPSDLTTGRAAREMAAIAIGKWKRKGNVSCHLPAHREDAVREP